MNSSIKTHNCFYILIFNKILVLLAQIRPLFFFIDEKEEEKKQANGKLKEEKKSLTLISFAED